MAYDKEVLSAALRELEDLRMQTEQALSARRAEVYSKIPRIQQIENTLRQAAALVVRAALESGDDPAEAVAKLAGQNLALQQERSALLQSHGYPADYLTPKPACPVCSDQGYIGTRRCECLKKRYSKKLLLKLSTILPVVDQNFETFNYSFYSNTPDSRLGISPRESIEENYHTCYQFAHSFNAQSGNLLLYGSAGLGKTFLSSCIAKVVSERGYSVAYDTAISMLSHYEAIKFGGMNAAQSAEHLTKYRRADLLIIDDLGAELTTSFTMSALYDVLNERLMTGRSTIINTNLKPEDIEKRYSPAIASRILGEFRQLRFIGSDIRMQKRRLGIK